MPLKLVLAAFKKRKSWPKRLVK